MALQIEIDASAAKAQLDQFKQSLTDVSTAIDQFATKGSESLKKFETAVASFKPIPSGVLTSITQLGQAAAGLSNLTGIKGLAAELTKLAGLNVTNLATQLNAISRALASFRVPAGLPQMAASLTQLAAALNNVGNAAGRASGQVQGFGNAARGAQGGVSALNGVGQMLSNTLKTLATALGAASFMQFIKGAFDAVTVMDKFSNVITAVEGHTSAVGTELAFVSGVAKSTSQSFGDLVSSFGSFDAAARLAGVSAQDTKEIFENVNVATRTLKLSGDRVRLVFLALEQMFSKGSVSMEELRRQLGEQIPGAFQTFAKSANMSGAELTAAMKAGQVGIENILPFTRLLKEEFEGGLAGAIHTAQAAMANFQSAMFRVQEAFGRGFFDAFKEGLNSVSDQLQNGAIVDNFAKIGKVMGELAGIATTMFGGLVSAVSGLIDLFSTALSPITAFMEGIKNALATTNLLAPAITLATFALEALGAVIGAITIVSMVRGFAALIPVLFGVATGARTAAGAFLLFNLSPMVLAVTAAIAVIGFAIGKVSEWNAHQRELNQALQPTPEALAKLDGTLGPLNEKMADMAVKMGFSAEQAANWAAGVTKAAAAPEVLAKAQEDVTQALRLKADALRNDITTIQENVRAMIAQAIATGDNSAATHDAIQTGKEMVKAREKELTETELLTKKSGDLHTSYENQVISGGKAKTANEQLAESIRTGTKSFSQAVEEWHKFNGGVEGFLVSMGKVLGIAPEFAEKTGKVADNAGRAATEVGKVGPAADAAATGMGKASSDASSLAPQLDAVAKAANAAADALARVNNAKANTNPNAEGILSGPVLPFGGQREGGMAGDRSSTESMNPSRFINAPRFAEGTTGTTGGGIPSILHPNEAVIPLSRGRQVPVQLMAPQQSAPANNIAQKILDEQTMLNKNFTMFMSMATAEMARSTTPADVRPATASAPVVVQTFEQQQVPRLEANPLAFTRPAPQSNTPAASKDTQRNITINAPISIKVDKADSLKRSADQIHRQLAEGLERAVRRIG